MLIADRANPKIAFSDEHKLVSFVPPAIAGGRRDKGPMPSFPTESGFGERTLHFYDSLCPLGMVVSHRNL